MKKRPLFLPLLTLGALAALVLALVWFISGDNSHPASVARDQGNRPSESSFPDRPLARAGQPEPGAESVAAPAQAASRPPAPPAGIDPFAPALSDAELLRTERRMFQAQTWEVDLGKALDLRPSERLERRSGLFRLAGGGGLVRLDRVYRLGGVRPAVAAKTSAQGAPASAPALAAADDPTGPLDAGGGELVWANAMVADHLMVQVENGVTRERLAASLPALAHVGKQVTAGGLYLVEVPTEGERSVERAVLALNQIKGVVKFAEPNFVLTSADTTTNDPLFTANAADLSKQWHLAKIRAPRAWDVLTGPPFPPAHPQYQPRLAQTVVAVVDTGIDYTHPDLAPNMWTNPGETGGGKETNNIDDDGNGKIDDWRGYDFIDNDNNPMDDVGHGTHVAGIIGAVGNNATGGSGVCWNVKLLNLRIIKAQGTGTYGTYSAAIAALDYIRVLNTTGRKVAVANHSWGGNGYSLAMLNAVNNPLATADPLPTGITSTYPIDVNQITVAGSAAELTKIKLGMKVTGTGIPIANSTRDDTLITIVEGTKITLSNYTTLVGSGAALAFSNPISPKPYGVVHVAAAGNSQVNADRIPIYPACLPSGFVISVGAVDAADVVASWGLVLPPTGSPYTSGSNYGRLNVDLFAPGSTVWSTKWKAPGDVAYGYESRNGTSMAAPQVAGALALVRMWQPNLTELQARQVVIEQAEVIPSLQNKCMSSGRLNIARIIDRLYAPVLTSSGGSTSGAVTTAYPLTGGMGVHGQIAVCNRVLYRIDQGKVWAWGENLSALTQVPLPDGIIMIAGVFALRDDGTVWTLGYSENTGGAPSQYSQIPSLSDVVWIASSGYGGLAVKADGTVWGWGTNQDGNLGPPLFVNKPVPEQIAGLSDVIQVDMSTIPGSGGGSVALTADGRVYEWGNSGSYSSDPIQPNPTLVMGLDNVVFVAVKYMRKTALKSDGTVWEWGRLDQQYQPVPTQVVNLSNIVQISAGSTHRLALDSDGRVFAWGDNGSGQLGNNSDQASTTPTLVSFPESKAIVAVTCDFFSSLAVTSDGEVFTWGGNFYGQLGNGLTTASQLPVQVKAAEPMTQIFSGGRGTYGLTAAGDVYRWGACGPDTSTETLDQITQLKLPRLSNAVSAVRAVTVSNKHVAVLKTDGTVWNWGYDIRGSLGNGLDHWGIWREPAQVSGVSNAVAIATSDAFQYSHTLVVMADGTLKAWGSNRQGQLGDGLLHGPYGPTGDYSISPVDVPIPATIIAVACGDAHSLALTSDGHVWSWGQNARGKLGLGDEVERRTPQLINGLENVVNIDCGLESSWAVKADGTVYCWGRIWEQGFPNYLSPGSTPINIDHLLPIQVPTLSNIARIVCGNNMAIGLTKDGRVLSWGSNDPVKLGRYTTPITYHRPDYVVGMSGIVDIAACFNGGYAVKGDGTVYSWGNGGSGTLGNGSAWSDVPIEVLGFAGSSRTLSSLGATDVSASWLLSNFSIGELIQDAVVGDNASPAGDGISNLVKYALGLNPKQRYGASSLPTVRVDLIGAEAQSTEATGGIGLFSVPTVDLTSAKRYLAFTVPRNGIHLDVDYVVEVSGDLHNWLSGDPFTITVLDTAETLEVYDATAIEDASQRFMRLRIQRK